MPSALDDQGIDAGLLVLIDIDHFKRINDRYGHAAGYEVLKQFSSVLRGSSREVDVIARWGVRSS